MNPPNVRASWDQRELDTWYVGPAWDHYRVMTFYVQPAGGTRILANSQLYPVHCKVPRETVMNEAVRVANDLVNAIKKLQGQERIQPGRHASALMKLSEIFQ